jgi:uncharacterized protein (DUF488 family)
MANPFFTIGHSTRSIAEFIELLRSAEVQVVADVRKMPRSRANPQYNRAALAAALAPHQIRYEHFAGLGGLRGKQRDGRASSAFWTNPSFRNYADYATTEAFRSCFARLRGLGHQHRCAIMCAEAVWWRCHRRIIADYLISNGESVFHILGPGHVQAATITPQARREPDGTLAYPAP